MFKTKPFVSDKIWGYEHWIVSALESGMTVIASETDGQYGKPITAAVGADYPLLIKIIQAHETLSVQVHPDDEYAKAHGLSSGKTECWYVLEAKPDSSIVYGCNASYTCTELEQAIHAHSLETYLRYIPVAKGDFIFIPAGTIHAIQGGLKLLEIQQPSDVTYRLYDWGRPREVHIQEGLQALRYSDDYSLHLQKPFSGFFTCPYFTLEKQIICRKERVSLPADCYSCNTPALQCGWYSLFIISGNGLLYTCNDIDKKIQIRQDDCIMLELDKRTILEPLPYSELEYMLIY